MKYTREEIELLKKKYTLSQSAMKNLIDREGNEIMYCAKQFAETFITKRWKWPDKEAFKRGRYFETLAIGGSSSHGKGEDNEPERKIQSKRQMMLEQKGNKKVSTERIEEQAENFKKNAAHKNLTYADYNTQVVVYKVINPEAPIKEWKLFRGEIDWGPVPTKTKTYGRTITLIDLKLSADLSNLFGPYAWANHEYVNKIQSYSYVDMMKNIDLELNDIINPGNNIREALWRCGHKMIEIDNPNLAEAIDVDDISEEEIELLTNMVTTLIDSGNINFIYWIYDFSPRKENLIVPVEVNKTTQLILKETIRKSVNIVEEIIDYYKTNKEFKLNAHPTLCQECHIKDCEVKTDKEFLY